MFDLSLAIVVVSSAMVSFLFLIVAACMSRIEFLDVAALARLLRVSMRSVGTLEAVVAWTPRIECWWVVMCCIS